MMINDYLTERYPIEYIIMGNYQELENFQFAEWCPAINNCLSFSINPTNLWTSY